MVWGSYTTRRVDILDLEARFASSLKQQPQRNRDVFPKLKTEAMPLRSIPPATFSVTVVRDQTHILQWSCVRDVHPQERPTSPFPSIFDALHSSLLQDPLEVLHQFSSASIVLSAAPATALSRFNVFQDAVHDWCMWKHHDPGPTSEEPFFPETTCTRRSLRELHAMEDVWKRVKASPRWVWSPRWWDATIHATMPRYSCATAVVFRLFLLDQLHQEHIFTQVLGSGQGKLFNLGVAMDSHIPLAIRLDELAPEDATDAHLLQSGLYTMAFPHHDNPNQPPHLFSVPRLPNILFTFRRQVPSSVPWLQCMIAKLRPVVLSYRRLSPSIANKCVRFLVHGNGFQMNVVRSFVLTSMLGNIPWATWIAPLRMRMHMQRIFFPDAKNGWDRALYWITTRNTSKFAPPGHNIPPRPRETPTYSNEHSIVLGFYETLIASSYLLPSLHRTLCDLYDWFSWATAIRHTQEHGRRLMCSFAPRTHTNPESFVRAVQVVFHIVRHCFANIKTSVFPHVFQRYTHAPPHNQMIKNGMGARMSGRGNRAKNHKRVNVVRIGVLKLPKIFGIYPTVIGTTKRAIATLRTAGLFTEEFGDLMAGYVSGCPEDTACLRRIRAMKRPTRTKVVREINKMTPQGMGFYKIIHLVRHGPLEVLAMPEDWGIHQRASIQARHNIDKLPDTMQEWPVCLSCNRVCREVVTTANVFQAIFNIHPNVARRWRRSFYTPLGGNHINASVHAQRHLEAIRKAVLEPASSPSPQKRPRRGSRATGSAGDGRVPHMLTGDISEDARLYRLEQNRGEWLDEIEEDGTDGDSHSDSDVDMGGDGGEDSDDGMQHGHTRRPRPKRGTSKTSKPPTLLDGIDLGLGDLDIGELGLEVDLSGFDLQDGAGDADGMTSVEESMAVQHAKASLDTAEDKFAADIMLAKARHGHLDEDADVLRLERDALGKSTGVVGADTNSKRKSGEHIRNISNQGTNNVSIGPCSACGGFYGLLGRRSRAGPTACRTCGGKGIQYRCNFKIDINTTTTHAKPHCWKRLHFVPALGTLMHLRGYVYFVCPEPGCGIHARMDARILNRGRIQCAWCHFKAWQRERHKWDVPLLRPMTLYNTHHCMKCGCPVQMVDTIHKGVTSRKLVGSQRIPRPPSGGGHALPLTDPETGDVKLYTVCASCWKPVLLHVDIPTFADDMSRILSHYRRARSREIQRRVQNSHNPMFQNYALGGSEGIVAPSSRRSTDRSLASRVQEFLRISAQAGVVEEGALHHDHDHDETMERPAVLSDTHLAHAFGNTLDSLS